MPAIERALVVGGGPAGLAAATTLRKSGIAVDVLEINDHQRPLGSGLTMQSPTLRALRSVDEQALWRCIAGGCGHDRTLIGDAEGNVLVDRSSGRSSSLTPPAVTANVRRWALDRSGP